MVALGGIVFLAPLVLLGLLALPLLWWLLRATPPSPVHIKFPGVQLLLGLFDRDKVSDRTPWWLLLLRLLAMAAAIIAFAEPVINPEESPDREGPLLILFDGGWANAGDWTARLEELEQVLEDAARAGRPTALINLSDAIPEQATLSFRDARELVTGARALEAAAWQPDREGYARWLEAQDVTFDSVWLTDNIAYDDSDLASLLQERGNVQVFASNADPMALRPMRIEEGAFVIDAIARPLDQDRDVTITIFGTAPNGAELRLAEETVQFPATAYFTEARFELPLELRNRVTRAVLSNQSHAAAVVLADDGLRRRKVALIGTSIQEGPQLVDPMFYLRKALEPNVELVEGELSELLLTAPDVLILADAGELSLSDSEKLIAWIEEGGLLVRFAGPRLAASGAGQLVEVPLLPVRLRAGGRNLGGAMTWGDPKQLEPFAESSPFFGLAIPDDVTVSAQVVAQPSPELSERTLASLTDGTPLVTAKSLGEGRVILFHVTANAEWSNLPLSGLFVQMLERLSVVSGGEPLAAELAGRRWLLERELNGYGRLSDPEPMQPVDGERLIDDPVGPDAPPGLYSSGELTAAVNVMSSDSVLESITWPAGLVPIIPGEQEEQALKHWFLLAALVLLLVDVLATLFVSGRLRNMKAAHAATTGLLAMGLFLSADPGQAQDDIDAIRSANDTVLAYVLTGDPAIDRVSHAGLLGLSVILSERTSIEPVEPIGVDIQRDELAFFPLLYWPIIETQRPLTPEAIEKLNRFMATGGTIFFDTRDANLGAGFGSGTANGRALQRLAAELNIPPLEPVPADHVLTRAFYLLQEFPGRWVGPDVWVEISTGTSTEGMTFAAANDGVSPVIIGANDWAAGWAIENDGRPMFTVGRGMNGARQRELAFRFGVNLVMYIMTGNYKSDQVHVPALLERLGE